MIEERPGHRGFVESTPNKDQEPNLAVELELMQQTQPDKLITPILTHLERSSEEPQALVRDALIATYYWYDSTSKYSGKRDVLDPLRVAQTFPDESFSPQITAIRLLGKIGQDFILPPRLEAYGDDVTFGVTALTPKRGDTYENFFQDINKADRERPDLLLVPTQARIMILDALDPVALPGTVVRYKIHIDEKEERIQAYRSSCEKLFSPDKVQHNQLYRKVTHALDLAQQAYLTPNWILPKRRQ